MFSTHLASSSLSTLLVTLQIWKAEIKHNFGEKWQVEIFYDYRILVRGIIHLTNMYLVTGYNILKDKKWKSMRLKRISGHEINISAPTLKLGHFPFYV